MTKASLQRQAEEIKKISTLSDPYDKNLVDLDLTIFPHVYGGGSDSRLMCEVMEVYKGDEVLDLCTGMGVIALKAATLGAGHVIGVDLNPEAVKNANFNKKKLGLKNIEFIEGDLFEPVKDKKFDVITINPPFTAKKPSNKTEICFWDENNQATKRFFRELKSHLKPGARVYLSWGDFADLKLLPELAKENNLEIKELNSAIGPGTGFGFMTYGLFRLDETN
ncbi:MAG TPA: methyltransferase domain-containing protein [Candidatus Saccharimonadales bacterium]|nr:methyltransferase domain-containing protein [Candidatus Saccharimonadales bacterium]